MPLARRTVWIGVGPVGMRVVTEARRRARERWRLPAGAAFVRLEGPVGGALDPALERLARPPRLDGAAEGRAVRWTTTGDGMPPDVATIVVASLPTDGQAAQLADVVTAARAAIAGRLAASTSVTAVLLAPAAGQPGAGASSSIGQRVDDADGPTARDEDAIFDGGRIVLASVTAAGWRFPRRADRIAGAAELVLHLALLGPDRWPDLVPDPAADVRTAGLALAVVDRNAAVEHAARGVALDHIARLLGDVDDDRGSAVPPSFDGVAGLPTAAGLIDGLAGALDVRAGPAGDPHAADPRTFDPHAAVQSALARLAWATAQAEALNDGAAALLRRWEESFDTALDGAVAGPTAHDLGTVARSLDGLRAACDATRAAAVSAAAAAQDDIAAIDAALEEEAAALSRLAPDRTVRPPSGCRFRLRAFLHRRAAARARAQFVRAAATVTALLDAKREAVLTACAQCSAAQAAGAAAERVGEAHARAYGLTAALLRAQAIVADAAGPADGGSVGTAPCFELSLPVDGIAAVVQAALDARRGNGGGTEVVDAAEWWHDAPPAAELASTVLDAARQVVGQSLDDALSRAGTSPAADLAEAIAATALLRQAAVPWLTWDGTALSPVEDAPLETRWVLAVAGGARSALWQAVRQEEWHAVIDNRDPLRIGVVVEVRGLGTGEARTGDGPSASPSASAWTWTGAG